MTARDNILARIRAAQGRSGAPSGREREAVRAHIRSHPQSPRPRLDWDPVTRFRERVLSLACTCEEIASRQDLPAAIAGHLRASDLPASAVCWPEFSGLDWAGSGLTVEGRNARGDDLVGITGAFCGIAETGTLMLVSGPHTPAATSLLPETHIVVIGKARIVPGMEEAWQLLRDELAAPPRAVNFISGPSRTADIEQTVTLGAHGPYRVHVVLVGAA